jgi:hypothetical protein
MRWEAEWFSREIPPRSLAAGLDEASVTSRGKRLESRGAGSRKVRRSPIPAAGGRGPGLHARRFEASRVRTGAAETDPNDPLALPWIPWVTGTSGGHRHAQSSSNEAPALDIMEQKTA